MTLSWLNLLFLLVSIRLVYSNPLVNVTIDDSTGDEFTGVQVDYQPPEGWIASGCNKCPSPSNVTYHTSVFNSGRGNDTTPRIASVQFYGSAVYVYCLTSFATPAHMVFRVDAMESVHFTMSSFGGGQAAPDASTLLVYAGGGLPMDNHTLTIQNGVPTSGESSTLMLDSIVYTTDKEVRGTVPAVSQSDSKSSKSSKVTVLTGVLVTVCILFAAVLAYLFYRVFATRASRSRAGILPVSAGQDRQFSLLRWVSSRLHFNASKSSISFHPSMLTSRRSRVRAESTKDLQALGSAPAILAEAGPEMQPKRPENRWALVMSWRDRATREAEIPSLPPTSHAPTTVFSGPISGASTIQPLQLQRPQQLQDRPETPRTQPRRTFTVMNV